MIVIGSGSVSPHAPGNRQRYNNHIINNVPAIVPITIPAIAPPERLFGHEQEGSEEDWRGLRRGWWSGVEGGAGAGGFWFWLLVFIVFTVYVGWVVVEPWFCGRADSGWRVTYHG